MVNMKEKKVSAVSKWPEPTLVKELQRFLGLADFYQCFIVLSLWRHRSPTFGKASKTPKHSHQKQLLALFVSVPIPDPSKPFVIKVDASEVRVGAFMSKQHGNPKKQVKSTGEQLTLVTKNCSQSTHWLEGFGTHLLS